VSSGDEIYFPNRKLAQKIYDYMSVALGYKCPSYCTVKKWLVRLGTGHLSTKDEGHSGRLTQVTIPQNMDAIHSMILND
jgi:hypothetical protein